MGVSKILNRTILLACLSVAGLVPAGNAVAQPPVAAVQQVTLPVEEPIDPAETGLFQFAPVKTFTTGEKVPATKSGDSIWSTEVQDVQAGTFHGSLPVLSTLRSSGDQVQVVVLATITLKENVAAGAAVHGDHFVLQANRAFQAHDNLPVLLVGDALISIESTAPAHAGGAAMPVLTAFPELASATERGAAVADWQTVLNHSGH